VPIKSSNSIDGWDSILSILQMPAGIPVATLALNNATNAGILAASIIGSFDINIAEALDAYKLKLRDKVDASSVSLQNQIHKRDGIGF
jgi:5-(carboxyamino)imidazole ribonucleotide mutase